jgi:hypothetical protein
MKAPTYFTGLDLGQAHEFTALAVLKRTLVGEPKPAHPPQRLYAVRHLHRFSLGTPYSEMAAHLATLFADKPLARSRLLVDQTIVGWPVLAELRRAKIQAKLTALTITNAQHADGLLVPKKELVSTMQILLQTRRLTIASSLPKADLLAEELANFKVKKPAIDGNDLADWREAPHDDLVFAVAIAAWQGEREPLPMRMKGMLATPGCPGLLPYPDPWR